MSKQRTIYLDRLRPFIGNNLIKVITGQRRIGKSELLKIVRHELTENGIACIYINKEDYAFDSIKDYHSLIAYVEENTTQEPTALFIDEVQEIGEFERALRHFHTLGAYDIYVTGSNAGLLSSELATLLSGRSIAFEVFSLSYTEFLDFHDLPDATESFDHYLHIGGMPNLIHLPREQSVVDEYLRNIYNTILVKDIITRYNIRNVPFIRSLSIFLADNIGSVTTSKSISDYLKSQQIKISPSVVQDYLRYISEAYFVHQVSRSNLQGKKILEIGEKYFFNDIGMRNALIGYRASDIGKILENVVYLHLRIAGYSVTVGHERNREIDFIAQRNNETLYVQVCYILENQNTIDREFGNLLAIKNNYPKMVVSMDTSSNTSYQGIKHQHIKDFCQEITL
jgi:predicted AAA+ superfamily ATPase